MITNIFLQAGVTDEVEGNPNDEVAVQQQQQEDSSSSVAAKTSQLDTQLKFLHNPWFSTKGQDSGVK